LLVLRPDPGAEGTVAKAREAGFDAQSYPLFLVAPLPWTGPEPHLVDAVMFTSANGARLGGAQLARYTHLPAFAVGGATAQAARDAGFASVESGDDGVQQLVPVLARQGHRNILHISGRDIRTFDPQGLRIVSACVYAAVERGNAEDLLALLTPGMILLVHSPRAGGRLADLVPLDRRSHLHIVAISAAAQTNCGEGWASASAAASPNDHAMLALAAGLCE
tara:strand:- start:92 stop:754 length:663 start_codon:yes stop_codon:yes gene_type:complete